KTGCQPRLEIIKSIRYLPPSFGGEPLRLRNIDLLLRTADMADIALAFFWHQHQPYYPDNVAGDNPMPWVRLHGVKDYYGMALHLLEYPEMRCTINLVPSLLGQLEGYTKRGATDRPLEVSRRPASGLAEVDALYLLDQFFMADHERMIRP